MKRVIIICEGPTEREFCNKTLAPFFSPQGIYIEAPVIKHSHGGIVPWRYLLRQIDIHLRSDQIAYVTTLIDYYGINDKHEFPCWEEAKKRANAIERVSVIEDGMLSSVGDSMRPRFIPYIQLHEFEGLLFSNAEVFEKVIPEDDLVGVDELQKTVAEYDNPEMINTSKETSPSHRLERIVHGYDKVVYGNYIAESIGLTKIRERCPRFNEWVTKICQLREL